MAIKLRGNHSLGDFLNDTFSMVPLIWKESLVVSAAALVPGVALWIATMGSLASWLKKIIARSGELGEDPSLVFSGLMPMILLGIAATIALYLGKAFQKAFVMAKAGAAMDGRKPGVRELLEVAFRRAWMKVFAQDLIIGSLSYSLAFAAIGLIFFPFFFGKLGDIARLKDSGGPGFGFIVSSIAIYFASILVAGVAVWWFRVKTAVAAPATVLEGANSFAGLGRSLDLVRGRGWRIFGVMFIVSLVISFALGIATGPFTFIAIIPGYFSFLKESLSGGTPTPETILALVNSMGWAMGLSIFITEVVRGTLWPTFLVLLHGDLRVRAGELAPWSEPEPALPVAPTEPAADGEAKGETQGGQLG